MVAEEGKPRGSVVVVRARRWGGGRRGERHGEGSRGEGSRIPERRRPVCGTPARSVESRRLRHNPISSSFFSWSVRPSQSFYLRFVRMPRLPVPSVSSHEAPFSVFNAPTLAILVQRQARSPPLPSFRNLSLRSSLARTKASVFVPLMVVTRSLSSSSFESRWLLESFDSVPLLPRLRVDFPTISVPRSSTSPYHRPLATSVLFE